MKIKITSVFCVIILLASFASCGVREEDYTYMLRQTDISEGILDVSRDTHTGVNSDGLLYSCFTFSDERCERFARELSVNPLWHALPLPQTLFVAAYGGRYEDTEYGILLKFSDGESSSLPEVQNGYWYFADRHMDSEDDDDYEQLLSRYSYNFVFALYDSDTGKLYYYRLDT